MSMAPVSQVPQREEPAPIDPSTPGWMMRTDRTNDEWLWSEVQAERLRQGWGYAPTQELPLLEIAGNAANR